MKMSKLFTGLFILILCGTLSVATVNLPLTMNHERPNSYATNINLPYDPKNINNDHKFSRHHNHHRQPRQHNSNVHPPSPIADYAVMHNGTVDTNRGPPKPLKLTLVNSHSNDFFQKNHQSFGYILPQQHHHHFNIPNVGAPAKPPNFDGNFNVNWRSLTTIPTTRSIVIRDSHRHRPQKPITKQHLGRHVCPIDDQSPSSQIEIFQVNNNPQEQICPPHKVCPNSKRPLISTNNFDNNRKLNCCPGWQQISKASLGCNKPICKIPCRNGGKCVKPDMCKCSEGFTGKYCERDVNECRELKPCDQTCYNTEGSYYCTCREGFILLADRQSCKKVVSTEHENAFEARDLENDVDYEHLNVKINTIEKLIGNGKQFNTEISHKLENTAEEVNKLRQRVENVEHRSQEINYYGQKFRDYDVQFRKLEHIVDVLYKCRNGQMYCP